MRNTNTIFLWLLGAGLWLGLLNGASAQTLVYRMEFKKSGNSINFEMFDGAYFVVDGLGGTGSFVVTYREDGRDFYLSTADSGTLFFAVRPGKERAIVRATAQAGTDGESHYLAIGDLSSRITVNLRGQRVTLAVAPVLRGWVLASDPENDVEFPPADGSIGVAGFATLKATLDRDRTRAANRANSDTASALQTLIADLESRGYESGASDTDTTETTTEAAP
ncbi:MAG: hypothetical protein KDM91_01595 [Verrucomicrobiae bacterium]|nr:hypothetical protein [Verrucomicrobiae bacterium]MCP5539467.1 hypothetical protein [Akkermansiaceae bacterium]MCP5551713.1 hypothetical protein [Akkermansiaceae bacterium]